MRPDHGSQLDRVLGELLLAAAWTGAPPAVKIDREIPVAARALCSRRGQSRSIRLHPAVLMDPPAVLRGTLAHELAHLQLRPQGWAAPAAGALLLSGLAVLAVTSMNGPGSGSVVIGAAAGLALASLTVWVGYQPRRRAELAADRLSSAWIGRDSAAATLLHLQAAERPIGRALATIGFAPHPTATQRLRHLVSAR